ncbi:MAG: cytochrome C [Paludibacter sp.]|nr:cytochrome C [Paludibacter sp.]
MKFHLLFYIIGFIFFGVHDANSQNSKKSPGELSRSHAELEGATNCVKCHIVGSGVTRAKCLDCHKEIKTNIEADKGYHASSEVTGKNCSYCHNEHHGRSFKIIRFDKNKFNHSKTGFTLKGKHAKLQCEACHNQHRITDPNLKKRKTTYLGLNQDCKSCHDDYHQSKMAAKCSDCHSFDAWKNAKSFDHSKTKFPLRGKHVKIDCIKCHKTETVNNKTVQKFTGLAFANCTACHKDVHKNKFGQDCKSCHTEESFQFNKKMNVFDHDKTNFKLAGKHKLLDCNKCHKTTMTASVKHRQCNDCHKDFHNGDFAIQGTKPDCSECHTNYKFSPSNYTIEKHNAAKFPLDGAHLATSCSSCHKKEGKNWTFKNMGQRCVDCHKNEHKGFIGEKYFPNEDCQACHNTSSWKKVAFDHNRTRFKLEGKHAAIACSECHYRRNEKDVKVQKFIGNSMECTACHKDNHKGQFAENGKTNCTKCHGFDQWKNSKYDHNTSRFKIDGKHIGVQCNQCHKPVINEKGKYIEYKFDSINCSKCHS